MLVSHTWYVGSFVSLPLPPHRTRLGSKPADMDFFISDLIYIYPIEAGGESSTRPSYVLLPLCFCPAQALHQRRHIPNRHLMSIFIGSGVRDMTKACSESAFMLPLASATAASTPSSPWFTSCSYLGFTLPRLWIRPSRPEIYLCRQVVIFFFLFLAPYIFSTLFSFIISRLFFSLVVSMLSKGSFVIISFRKNIFWRDIFTLHKLLNLVWLENMLFNIHNRYRFETLRR